MSILSNVCQRSEPSALTARQIRRRRHRRVFECFRPTVEQLEQRDTPAPLYFDYPFAPPDGTARCPGTGRCSTGWQNVQDFGEELHVPGRDHLGEDWQYGLSDSDDEGLPIFAIADGIVIFANGFGAGHSWDGVIITRHMGDMWFPGGSYRTGATVDAVYGHLRSSSIHTWVTDQQYVYRGQILGVIGRPSTGPHFHFELRIGTPALQVSEGTSPPPGCEPPITVSYPAGCGYGPRGEDARDYGWTDPSDFIDANSPPNTGRIDASFNTWSLSDDGLASMRPYSDASIVASVGSTRSLDVTPFLALTTRGAASTADMSFSSPAATTGSVVFSKAFMVPPNAQLAYETRFLTNESPSDSTYNDFAVLHLVNAFGEISSRVTVTYVDTFAPLTGGAVEGYARSTAWRSSSFSLDSWVHAWMPYKLMITVSDRRDTIVDSAFLLDNVRIVTRQVAETFDVGGTGTPRTAGLFLQPGSSAKIIDNRDTVMFPLARSGSGNYLMVDNEGTVPTGTWGGTAGSVITTKPFYAEYGGIVQFYYNFLTSEYVPEYTYRDFVKVNLLSATGAVLRESLFSVDTTASGFVDVGVGGFRSMTNWRPFAVSLSAYAGQQVKLQFVVSNVGDTYFKSALLLDDLYTYF